MDGSVSFESIVQVLDPRRIPLALFLLIGGLFGLNFLGRLLDDMGERFTAYRLSLKKLKAILRFVIYLMLAVVVPASVLRDTSGLLPLFASLGVGLGFAFKDVFASWMAGVLLVIDEPFQVGDRVSFGDFYGEITEIGLRSVRLVTLDDSVVTIPNSAFLTQSVSSGNAGALDMMVVVPFYISPAEDFDEARRILLEVAATSSYIFLDKPMFTVLYDQFMGERFVTVIDLKAYVFDARFEKAYLTDVSERAKRAFRQAGIRTPDRAYRDLEAFGQETPEPQETPTP